MLNVFVWYGIHHFSKYVLFPQPFWLYPVCLKFSTGIGWLQGLQMHLYALGMQATAINLRFFIKWQKASRLSYSPGGYRHSSHMSKSFWRRKVKMSQERMGGEEQRARGWQWQRRTEQGAASTVRAAMTEPGEAQGRHGWSGREGSHWQPNYVVLGPSGFHLE